MISGWDEIVKERRQYDCWDLEKELPKEIIHEILQEMHTFCAKKQNKPYLNIQVFDWSDPEFRSEFHTFSSIREDPEHVYSNTQVLANYVIVFLKPRDLKKDKDFLHFMSTGIHADFVAHAATARGLATGFCQCNDISLVTQQQQDNLLSKLDIRDFAEISLVLGIGHGIKEPVMTDPYTGKQYKSIARIYPESEHNPSPDLEQYVKFL